MLNIVIPMAGHGSRFSAAGYLDPKPMIRIHGRMMIEVVVRNISPTRPHRMIFLCLQRHLNELGIRDVLSNLVPGCIIIPVSEVTDGAACTVLLARHYIDNDQPLMIANSDQWVDVKIDQYLDVMDSQSADGLIMTMPAHDPKWSYLRFGPSGQVIEVVEKVVVSNEATVGIYNFNRGRDFVRAAEAMIAKGLMVNGEFYIAPTYNELIAEGASIAWFNVGTKMHGLGTPADLAQFMTKQESYRASGHE